jgi:hypothetical protein
MKRLFCYSLIFAPTFGFASMTFAQFGGPVNGASLTGRNNLGQNTISGVNGASLTGRNNLGQNDAPAD